jgi:hypothetical protein
MSKHCCPITKPILFLKTQAPLWKNTQRSLTIA